jgi:hypothetical protein
LAGLIVLHVMLALLVFQPAPHTGGDNAGYLTLARSLLERHEYLDLYDPAEPPHTKYPPVFPAILAIALALGLKPWVQLKLLTVGFSALAVAFSYLWIRRRGRPELATGVGLLLAVSPGVLEQSHWVLSDVPFWALTMVAIWAWQYVSPSLRGRFIIAVAMTVCAYFTRSAGLPLLLAAGTWLALRRRWLQLASFAVVIVPLALWWWLRARVPGGVDDYATQFWAIDPYNPAAGRIGMADLFSRIGDNAGRYLSRHLPVLLFGKEGMLPVSVSIVALALYGWIMRIRKPGIGELFFPIFLGLLLVWPAVWSAERFLLPALPFVLFYAGDGLVRVARLMSRHAARLVPAAAAALLILFGIPATSEAIRSGRQCTQIYRAGDRYACLAQPWQDFFRIAELAPRVLPDDAVVLSRKERSFYIVGGVRGRHFPLSPEPTTFFEAAANARARYVVFDGLDGLSQSYLAPVLLGRAEAFCILFSLGRDGPVLFGIDSAAATRLPDTGARSGGSFAQCGNEYWRSPAVKDSLYNGLIPLN